ncbi:uncharacterized [Tachysurus ichikawai]
MAELRGHAGDAAAPVIWDSEAVGNACEGLKRCTSNKAWYELTSINNDAQLETANKSIPSGEQPLHSVSSKITLVPGVRQRPRSFNKGLSQHSDFRIFHLGEDGSGLEAAR